MIRISKAVTELCSTDTGKEVSEKLLPTLLENIKNLDHKIGKRLTIIVFLCLVFELSIRSNIGEIEYSGIKINNHGIIERIIPALIAFLHFESWQMVGTRRLLEDLHDKIVQLVYPSLWSEDLELYLRPPHIIKSHILLAREVGGKRSKLLDFSLYPILIVLAFSIPLFLVYALIMLVGKFGWTDPLTILSVLAVIFFLFQMLLFSTTVDRVTKEAPASP